MTYEQAMERIKAFIRQHDSSTDPDIGLDMALGVIQYHIDELEDKANKRIAELEAIIEKMKPKPIDNFQGGKPYILERDPNEPEPTVQWAKEAHDGK